MQDCHPCYTPNASEKLPAQDRHTAGAMHHAASAKSIFAHDWKVVHVPMPHMLLPCESITESLMLAIVEGYCDGDSRSFQVS